MYGLGGATVDGDAGVDGQGVGQVPGRQRQQHGGRGESPVVVLQRWRQPELAGGRGRVAAQSAVGQVPGRVGRQLLRRCPRAPVDLPRWSEPEMDPTPLLS